jgi:TonB-linked SusC/RagA family outer membrane protein
MENAIHNYWIKRNPGRENSTNLMYRIGILIFFCLFSSLRIGTTQDISNPFPAPDTTDRVTQPLDFDHIALGSHFAHGKDQILNVLKGQFSGINLMSSSGAPGASVSALIRGYSSVLRSNAPLIILDGMPINNDEWGASTSGVDLSNRSIDINVMDIDSISILRGPLATARYGLRGGNGVLVLKSKSGRTQKPKVNIYSSVYVQSVSQLPERQSSYAQGRPQNGVPIYRGPEKSEQYSWGPDIRLLEYDRTVNYPYDTNGELVEKGIGSNIPANVYDPYDFFVQDVSYQTHVDLSGRTGSLDYFLSAGKSHSDGFSPNAKFDKSTFHGRLGTYLFKSLKVDFSGFYTTSNGYRLLKGSTVHGMMLGLTRNAPTFDIGNGKKGNDAANDPESYTTGPFSPRSYFVSYDNPYWSVNRNPFEDRVTRQIYNLSLQYRLNQKTQLLGRIGSDSFNELRTGGIDVNRDVRPSIGQPGSVFKNDIDHNRIDADFQLVYDHLKLNQFKLSGLLGWNYYQAKTEDQSVMGDEMITPGIFTIENTLEHVSKSNRLSRKMIGLYADAQLKYDRFFQLGMVVRNDWSSALSANGRSHLSYAFQGDLFLNEIAGTPKNSYIDFARLNIGYGRSALDAPPYLTDDFYTNLVVSGDAFIPEQEDISPNGIQQYEVSSIKGNPNLGAEKTGSFEIGLDFSLGASKLTGRITYYKQVTSDLILLNDIVTSTGHNTWYANGGTISNKGIELDLGIKLIEQNSIQWDMGIHYTRNRNMVEDLPLTLSSDHLGGFNSTSSRLIEGSPYGVIYGDGFLRGDRGVLNIDEEGWPIQDREKKILGNPNHDWTVSFDQQIKLFDFITVNAMVDIMSGADLWCGTCGTMGYFGTSRETGDQRLEEFVFTGVKEDGTQNMTPVILGGESGSFSDSYWTRYSFGGVTEQNIHKASWIRLRNITIGFKLPGSILRRIPISDITFNLFANNLLLITNYPGIDPETNLEGTSNGRGIDYQNTPGRRFVGFGIQISI